MTNVYLMTYNPARWEWQGRDEFLTEVMHAREKDEALLSTWSTGSRTSGLGPGDEFYLLRQGPEPRGIIAHGRVESEVNQGEHWDGGGGLGNYVEVSFAEAVAADDPLPLTDLKAAAPDQHWSPQGSGSQLRPEYVAIVEELWVGHAFE